MNFKKIIAKYWYKNATFITKKVNYELKKTIIINKLQSINLTSKEPIINEKDNSLIVSLTTFGRRISDVYLAIETIGLQTMKPSKVILWLAEDEFDEKDLPVSLKNLQNRGLTIDYYKDIKAYKKLIPTLQRYKDCLILTIDDDVVYNWDLIEVLYKNYLSNPNVIHCGAAKQIVINSNEFTSYNSWKQNINETFTPSKMNFSVGFGGVLYFPDCFHTDILDENRFMHLTPHNDDIWFKMMSLLKGIKVKSVVNQFSKTSPLFPIEIAQEDSLSIINVVKKKNDEQLRNVFSAYNGISLLR
jgi:hypothetical protein